MSATVPMPAGLPWGRRELGILVALNVLGAALILLAWFWSSGSGEPQMAPLHLAVVAMIVAGGTNGGWLMRGRRAIGARRRAWLADLTGGSVARAAEPTCPVAVPTPVSAEDHVLVVRTEGALRFHRPGCALIVDRPALTTSRGAATSLGKISCGACGA